jgi:hypothetical protein
MGGMFTVIKVRDGLARNEYGILAGMRIPREPWRGDSKTNDRRPTMKFLLACLIAWYSQ